MDRYIANYLGYSTNKFPLDCESMDYIQDNNSMAQIIGNIVGDKAFLYGCTLSGSSYSPGYVFLKTNDYPAGEVLYWGGGTPTNSLVYVVTEGIDVKTPDNESFPGAYHKRYLSSTAQASSESYNINEFTYASANGPLYGEIKIWSGNPSNIPDGYLLCDGTAYSKDLYPHLYSVIGTTFNNQHIGTSYTDNDVSTWVDPASGYFRVPDLRSRFIMGCDSAGSVAGTSLQPNGFSYGKAGGYSTYALTAAESGCPSHNHNATTSIYANGTHQHNSMGESYMSVGGKTWPYGTDPLFTGRSKASNVGSSGGLDGDNYFFKTSFDGLHSHVAKTTIRNSTAINAQKEHENKPPFMVLCYIIRAK